MPKGTLKVLFFSVFPKMELACLQLGKEGKQPQFGCLRLHLYLSTKGGGAKSGSSVPE